MNLNLFIVSIRVQINHKGGDIHSNISSTDRCIFVEPVKEIYEVLQTNLNRDYPNNNFVLRSIFVYFYEKLFVF